MLLQIFNRIHSRPLEVDDELYDEYIYFAIYSHDKVLLLQIFNIMHIPRVNRRSTINMTNISLLQIRIFRYIYIYGHDGYRSLDQVNQINY